MSGADAWSMAEAVRAGETSSVELVEAALATIAAKDGEINAFTVVLAERALDAARDADRRPR